MTISRALISVFDKNGLEELGNFLQKSGVEIFSTGGTAEALVSAGIKVIEVSDYTRFPEMMDGRVKTLHPKIHGGILGKRDSQPHIESMEANEILPIDLVVVNLYPFESTVAGDSAFTDCIENIDIGGPTLIRAAAKNHESVTVITDPRDYNWVMEEMMANSGTTTISTRRTLASSAFARTGAYDAAISNWFSKQTGERFTRFFAFGGERIQTLRYGENPHQSAALYGCDLSKSVISSKEQIQGKALSYNNINDANAGLELVNEFHDPAVVIIKHANPCGVAEATSILEAFRSALKCDPVSAFGGVIAINRILDAETAGEICKLFFEVVITPGVEENARATLENKKNLRVLISKFVSNHNFDALIPTPLSNGFLLQTQDKINVDINSLEVVTKRQPTGQELNDLLFARKVSKHVKSNAIIYAKDGATVGIGAGQMSRLDSCRIAASKSAEAAKIAGEKEPLAKNSVVASDAFFPFSDGLLAAAEVGVTAIIQPGGSVRDEEIISSANEHNLAMVFTGIRNFRH